MKIPKLILGIFVFGISLSSCNKDDDIQSFNYHNQVVISASEYNTAPNDPLTIIELDIIGDSLKITFGSSGCDGETWDLKLIDSGAIMESAPPQRKLRLSLRNEELCDAYITKEVIYSIKSLQVDGNQVKLNITNSDDQVLYEY